MRDTGAQNRVNANQGHEGERRASCRPQGSSLLCPRTLPGDGAVGLPIRAPIDECKTSQGMGVGHGPPASSDVQRSLATADSCSLPAAVATMAETGPFTVSSFQLLDVVKGGCQTEETSLQTHNERRIPFIGLSVSPFLWVQTMLGQSAWIWSKDQDENKECLKMKERTCQTWHASIYQLRARSALCHLRLLRPLYTYESDI